jgi:beta-lactamase regulating signal transducer with metallopeptidase domain
MTAISILLKASVVFSVAAGIHAIFRSRMSAAGRHLLWTFVVIALLLLPILSAVLPPWPVFISLPGGAAQRAMELPSIISSIQNRGFMPAASARVQLPSGSTGLRPDRSTTFTLVYVVGFLLVMIRLLVDELRILRIRRRSTQISDPEWTNLTVECAAQIGLHHPVALLRDTENSMPMACGIRRRTIVVPAAADTWSTDRRRAVLLHEMAHLIRRDCLTQTLAAGACMIYWMHPATWWVARRLRIERELACDDRVISGGTNAGDYADHLLEVAYGLSSGHFAAIAVSMAGSGQLEGRLRALLDAARNRRIPRLRTYVVGTAFVLALLVPLAAVTMSGRILSSSRRTTSTAATLFTRTVQSFSLPAADAPGTWEIRSTGFPGVVQVQIREGRNSHGTTMALSDIAQYVKDLPAGFPQVDGPVKFEVPLEAGTFNVEGVVRSGVGAGTYTFVPDPKFGNELASRGFARPSAAEQRLLAKAMIGPRFLDELAAEGYTQPANLGDLLQAAGSGVSLMYVQSMAKLGYRLGKLDNLIDMRRHGISSDFIQELADEGLRLSADDLLRARMSGIDGEYVRDLARLGYSALSLDELVELRHHGIDPQYVQGLNESGYSNLSMDDLIELRGHGVDPNYIQGLASLGYAKLSLNRLVELRGHGVDPDYIHSLQDVGYKNLQTEDFVNLRQHGVSSDQAERANARAGRKLTVDELTALASRGWRD